MAQGNYNGSIAVTSNTAAENQTIPVTMRITSQPIAEAPTDRLRVRLAQGAPKLTTGVVVNNVGLGTLAIQNVASTGGSWLATSATSGGAIVTLDPGTLAPGISSGSITINSNAVNGPVTVPVDFEVVAKGPPVVPYQAIVDDAVFGFADVARGDILAVFGEQFAFGDPAAGPAPPLATQIGTTKVLVNGQPAPLFFSSYGQVNFQLPVDTTLGTAVIQVQREGVNSNPVSVNVVDRAPRLLRIGVGDYGAIQNQDFSIPMPVGSFPGVSTHPAQVGDTLTIYAIGLGPTAPSVGTGAGAPGAEPLARVTSNAIVTFGDGFSSVAVTPLFAGLSPGFAGLYQVNATIPQNVTVTNGRLNVAVQFLDGVTNTVQIAIQ
jgi:uncharacterized protein (TIGR03437 family)